MVQRLSNYSTGKFLKVYSGHVNKVYCITSTFSVTNGKYIVSGSEDNCIYLWDLQQKTMVQRLEAHSDTVVSVTCHPAENKIASAGLDRDRTIKIWVQDPWFFKKLYLDQCIDQFLFFLWIRIKYKVSSSFLYRKLFT